MTQQAKNESNPLHDSQDLSQLPKTINETDVVKALEARYNRDLCYTRVGLSTLVALNPGKAVNEPNNSAYDLEVICSKETLAHPIDIASGAYLHMVRALEDQVILTRYAIFLFPNLQSNSTIINFV
jgi:myosin heavy subunit